MTLRLFAALPVFFVSLLFLAIGASVMFVGDLFGDTAKMISGEK